MDTKTDDLRDVQEADLVDASTDETKSDEAKKKDVVAYESYMKALKEKKNASEKAKQLEEQLKIANEKLKSAENKKPENEAVNGIIEEFKSKLSATEKVLKEKEKEIIKKSFEYSFDKLATSAGCLDVEALMIKLTEDEQDVLSSNTINGKLDFSSEAVKAIFEQKKKNHSYLFKKEEEKEETNNKQKKVNATFKSADTLSYADKLKMLSRSI